MRMSKENARHLSRILMWRRIKQVTAVGGLFALLAILLVGAMEYRLSRIDSAQSFGQIAGTVSFAQPVGNGGGYRATVHLADGRDVQAISSLRLALVRGAYVIINETQHVSGRHSYSVARLIH